MFKKIAAALVIFCLVFEQSGFAQVAPQISIPAYLAGYLSPDRFRPVHLRSISFDQTTNNFNLLLDKGDVKNLRSSQLEETTRSLFEYFQIGLNLPNSMFWVNLRPDDPSNIIDPNVEKTDLGKVLLEADLQLKKDMAACTSPDTKEGRVYWNKLYAKAEELFGQSDIEIPTITRPWIVPGEIIMAQSGQSAYVYKAMLKVMLEQDYLKDAPGYNFDDAGFKELNEYSSRLIRTEILPKLTREVNSAKRYAALRQVYYSLILAQWYKQKQSQAFASQIDSRNLAGLTSKQAWSKETYYKAYKKSFEKGEYNKEETVSTSGGLTIRRYFSGGIIVQDPAQHAMQIDGIIPPKVSTPQVTFNNAALTVQARVLDDAMLPATSGVDNRAAADGGDAQDLTVIQRIKVWWVAEKITFGANALEIVDNNWQDEEKNELIALLRSYLSNNIVNEVLRYLTRIDRARNANRGALQLEVARSIQKYTDGSRDGVTTAVYIDQTVRVGIDHALRTSEEQREQTLQMIRESSFPKETAMLSENLEQIKTIAVDTMIDVYNTIDGDSVVAYLKIINASNDYSEYAREISAEALKRLADARGAFERDGGESESLENVIKAFTAQIRDAVRNEDDKKLAELAPQLIGAQREMIKARFGFVTVSPGVILSSSAAIKRLQKPGRNSVIIFGAGESINNVSEKDGLLGRMYTAQVYNLSGQGFSQNERLVFFDTIRGMKERYKDGGTGRDGKFPDEYGKILSRFPLIVQTPPFSGLSELNSIEQRIRNYARDKEVLVVDANDNSRNDIVRMFRGIGFSKVSVKTDVSQVFDGWLGDHTSADLILVNGDLRDLWLAERLRERHSNVPLLYMTDVDMNDPPKIVTEDKKRMDSAQRSGLVYRWISSNYQERDVLSALLDLSLAESNRDGGAFWNKKLDQEYIEQNSRKPISIGLIEGQGALHGYVVVIDPREDPASYMADIERLRKGDFTPQEIDDLTGKGFKPDEFNESKGTRLSIILYVQSADSSKYDGILKLADGVIQALGGWTSHGYKFCMEAEIPIVSEVDQVWLNFKKLKTGDWLTVDANNALIYAYPGSKQSIPLVDNKDGGQSDDNIVEGLRSDLNDLDHAKRLSAVKSLSNIKKRRGVAFWPLIRALDDSSPTVRMIAASALKKYRSTYAIGPLLASLNNPAGDISDGPHYIAAKAAAIDSLAMIPHQAAVRGLIDSFDKAYSNIIKIAIVKALVSTSDPLAYEALVDFLYTPGLTDMTRDRIQEEIYQFKPLENNLLERFPLKDGGTLTDNINAQELAARIRVYLNEEFTNYVDHYQFINRDTARDEIVRIILYSDDYIDRFYDRVVAGLYATQQIRVISAQKTIGHWEMRTDRQGVIIVDFNLDVPGEISVQVKKADPAHRDGGTPTLDELEHTEPAIWAKKVADDKNDGSNAESSGEINQSADQFDGGEADEILIAALKKDIQEAVLNKDDDKLQDLVLQLMNAQSKDILHYYRKFGEMEIYNGRSLQQKDVIRNLNGQSSDSNILSGDRIPLTRQEAIQGLKSQIYTARVYKFQNKKRQERTEYLALFTTVEYWKRGALQKDGGDIKEEIKKARERIVILQFLPKLDPEMIELHPDEAKQAIEELMAIGYKEAILVEAVQKIYVNILTLQYAQTESKIDAITKLSYIGYQGPELTDLLLLKEDEKLSGVYNAPTFAEENILVRFKAAESLFNSGYRSEDLLHSLFFVLRHSSDEKILESALNMFLDPSVDIGLALKIMNASLKKAVEDWEGKKDSRGTFPSQQLKDVLGRLLLNEFFNITETEQKDGGSESVQSLVRSITELLARLNVMISNKEPDTKGGIDLRALPVNAQPNGAISVTVPGTSVPLISANELETQWQQIEKQITSGPMPYDKLKAHAIACCRNKDAQAQREALVICITNILKLEEEAAVPTAPELKEILVALS